MSEPGQSEDEFTQAIERDRARLRNLFGAAPAMGFSGQAQPSSYEASAPYRSNPTPDHLYAAKGTTPDSNVIPPAVFDAAAGAEMTRTLTPEQRYRRLAGAGATPIENPVLDFMAEYRRMSPDMQMQALTGAGASSSWSEKEDEYRFGKRITYTDLEGNVRSAEADNLVPDDLRRKAETIEETAAKQASYGTMERQIARQYGLSLDDPALKTEYAWQYIGENHPELAQAAAQSGLTAEDVKNVNVLFRIRDLVQDGVALSSTGTLGADTAARQLMAFLPQQYQQLAIALLEDEWQKAQESAQAAQDQGENFWSVGGRFIWGLTAGPLLDALIFANEKSVQYVTAGVNTSIEAGEERNLAQAALQVAVPGSVFFTGAYSDAAPGTLNQGTLRELEDEYAAAAEADGLSPEVGRRAVRIAADVYTASQQGDEVFDAVLDKYSNDPEAMAIIQQGTVNPTLGGNTWMSDLYTKVSYADKGNLGSVVTTGLQIPETSAFATGVRDTTNIVGMVALDPTLGAGRVARAVRGMQYGIHNLTGTTNITNAFNKRGTKNWFNWYGGEVKKIKALEAKGDMKAAGRATTRLLSQSKRYANAETLRLFRKYNITNADEARNFMLGMDEAAKIGRGEPADTLIMQVDEAGETVLTPVRSASDEVVRDQLALTKSFIDSQYAKRADQVTVPHQMLWTGAVKELTSKARGALDITAASSDAGMAVIREYGGADWAALTPKQRSERLALILSDDAKVDEIADSLSDFIRTSDGSAKRTFLGTKSEKKSAIRKFFGIERTGFAKKNALRRDQESFLQGVARSADRLSRHWSRMPDTRGGLVTVDASDADKVYQMMRYGGVPRPAASMFRNEWINMSQAEREIASLGLFRTFARASGIDLVDMGKFEDMLRIGSGSKFRAGEQYAAYGVDAYGGVIARADIDARNVDQVIRHLENPKKNPIDDPQLVDEYRDLADEFEGLSIGEIRKTLRERAVTEAGKRDPALKEMPDGGRAYGAMWLDQTSDRVAMPNFAALDDVMARRSFFNALLFNNKFGQTFTDYWTFGTLAGPRFQLRNGLEDVVMYGITAGNFGGYARGRKMSTVIRGATARENSKLTAAQRILKTREKELKTAQDNFAPEDQLKQLQDGVTKAQSEVDRLTELGAPTQKLGSVNKMRQALAERIYKKSESENDLKARFANALFRGLTTSDERLAATQAKNSREAAKQVRQLQMKALVRSGLYNIKNVRIQKLMQAIESGELDNRIAKRLLTEDELQILRDMDSLLASPHALQFEQMAAETSRHLADGTMPLLDDMSPMVKGFDGKWYKRTYINSEYTSSKVSASGADIDEARGALYTLQAIASDGPRGQAIMLRLEEFWRAYNNVDPDPAVTKAIVGEALDYVKTTDMWPVYRERFRLNTTQDAEDFIMRGFLAATDTFTTPGGKFNRKLWDAMRQQTEDGKAFFSPVDAKTGNLLVKAEDMLPSGKFEPPYTVVKRDAESMLVPADGPLNRVIDGGWSMMGRSLARMTREPIWKANYHEARDLLRPLERAYAERFGAKNADKWATDAAAERAYALTMAYTDNPAVRSVLSWRVRNIARFYRAVEDFGRRMYRMGRNNPMAFWRASLLYQATLDTGFTYTDEYGQEYFLYPGSNAALTTLSKATEWVFGGDIRFEGTPTALSGQVAWLSPSADPDQWMPTFASPIASLIYRPMLRSLPGLAALAGDDVAMAAREFTTELDRAAFGSIGADKVLKTPIDGPIGEIVDSVPQALPTVLNRLIFGVALPMVGVQVDGSFGARLATQSVLMLEASGQGLNDEEIVNPTKIAEYRDRVEKVSIGMAIGLTLFGMAAPASPQLTPDNVTEFGRALELKSLRAPFIKLMNHEIENGGDYWTALEKWTAANPDMAVATLSSSELAEMGFVEALDGNASFAARHESVFEENPRSLSLFAPNTGESTMRSLRFLRMFGARTSKDIETYAQELATQSAFVEYTLLKREIDRRLDETSDEEERKALKGADKLIRQVYVTSGDYPGLGSRVDNFNMTSTEQWESEAINLSTTAEAIGDDGNGLGPEFLRVYNELWLPFRQAVRSIDPVDPEFDDKRDELQGAWKLAMIDEMPVHADNEQWERMLNILTKGLSSGWSLPETWEVNDARNGG